MTDSPAEKAWQEWETTNPLEWRRSNAFVAGWHARDGEVEQVIEQRHTALLAAQDAQREVASLHQRLAERKAVTEKIAEIHHEQHGDSPRYAPGATEDDAPIRWEPYVICDYDKTEWPCKTQLILSASSSDVLAETIRQAKAEAYEYAADRLGENQMIREGGVREWLLTRAAELRNGGEQ